MGRRQGLKPEAVALLKALCRSDARGMKILSERAAGRQLKNHADLRVMMGYLHASKEMIDEGYVLCKRHGSSVRMSITRKGRAAIGAEACAWHGTVAWVPITAALMVGCSQMVREEQMQETGGVGFVGMPVAQVYDKETGAGFFAFCSPCPTPTPKTLQLNNEPVVRSMPRQPDGQMQRVDANVNPSLSAQSVNANESDDASLQSKKYRLIGFPKAVAKINQAGKRSLSEMMPGAKKAERILIKGRTDSTGTPAGNKALALARAEAVKAVFVRNGIDPKKIEISTCVDCFVATNDTEEGRSANRRVEVELVMGTGPKL